MGRDMRRRTFLNGLATGILAPAALAQTPTAPATPPASPLADPLGEVGPQPYRAVVELFTSQGCSSCPPTHDVIAELAKDPGIIALTFPVDYWDYLGWKDTLGSAKYSDRQRAYARARGDGAI
jgi:hypothetical protein